MINTIKKSAIILRNNTVFIQPFFMFVILLFSIILAFNGKIVASYAQIILLILLSMLFIAFIAGWFFIIKLGVTSYNPNDTAEDITSKSVQNLKKFFEGVGCNIFRFLLGALIVFIIYFGVITVLSKLCMHFFGVAEMTKYMYKIHFASSPAEYSNIMNTIPVETKVTFAKWICVLFPTSILLNFFSVLYFAVIGFEEQNVLKCLKKSIVFFLKNIVFCLLVIVILSLMYFAIYLVSLVLPANTISLFVVTMLYSFYFIYYIILVFCLYYDKEQNNSDSRPECIGENETGDSDSETP